MHAYYVGFGLMILHVYVFFLQATASCTAMAIPWTLTAMAMTTIAWIKKKVVMTTFSCNIVDADFLSTWSYPRTFFTHVALVQ